MNSDFENIVKIISPKLKGITYKLNGHSSSFSDEDLFQEALMHLWVDFKAGKLQDKTESYILQGCYFHLKNHLRKVQDKANLVSLDTLINEGDTNLEERLSTGNPESCFDCLEGRLLMEGIQKEGFTKREREVLSFCLEGLTVREIGRRLSISHVRVVKLRARLKDKCAKYKDSP